ncbi:GMC family oxidoreductase [uncultured Sphingomonas sp.]|uniref:GMC family oxidoreductase N-terminal domain-containing protein n=1 Tax=uncultured Sphingomonas sp. TaxID=158754 RepID=UPI00260B952D|nr:GMC family oxidoreductase [uncultured Sphingomonas sp.]
MLEWLIGKLLWLYWRANRPFLVRFAPALIGPNPANPDLEPDGRAVIRELDRLLSLMTTAVFVQAASSVLAMPLWVPKRLPYSPVWRTLLFLFVPVWSQVARIGFCFRSKAARVRIVDTLFSRLGDQAAAEESLPIKSIIVIGAVKTLITGAYLDLDRTWRGLDYQRFQTRPWIPPSGPDLANPARSPASTLLMERRVRLADVAKKPGGRTTYLVIGSGAGGATAAYFIQQADPSARIVIVESGPLVPNDQLPDHLMQAASTIYMNGGFTLSADECSTFVQARTVGGGTLVNNSVAWKPDGFWWDEVVVKRWERFGVKLDWPRLHRSYDAMLALIHAAPVKPVVMAPMAETLRQGFADTGHGAVDVTIDTLNCIGCGRCNSGCRYAAKQSMNETTLPAVVAAGGLLVPDAHVTRLALDGPRGAQICRGAHVRGEDGVERLVEADKIVLAAGTFASTKILRRSGFSGALPGVRTVGKRFSGNMGTPVFGEFATDQFGARGIQVGYAIEMPDERMVIETAFGPPATIGMEAPQWGRDFMGLLDNYNRIAVAVPVIGANAYGTIDADLSASGYTISYKLDDDDWYRLTLGMKAAGKAMFAAGATRIGSSRFDATWATAPDQLDAYFGAVGPLQYLKVTTAHLQGGNVLHQSPAQGVVDMEMRVHGIDRLWITDASIIPSPITVNLQMTVMALAHYAAAGIVAAGA